MRTAVFATIAFLALFIAGCGTSGQLVTKSPETATASTPATAAATPALPADAPEAAWMRDGSTPRRQQPVVAQATPRQERTSTTPKPRPAAPTGSAKPLPKSPDVAILKLDPSEVPAEVRAIESVIDRKSALLADEVTIEVSKNYEWDVSLSGDGVSPQRPERGGTKAEATGNARAYFRNLDIRSRGKITVWRSGLGVTPFIKIYAAGAVSYIDTDAEGKPRVKRANACQISNAKIAFDNELIGMPAADAAKPVGATQSWR